MTSILNGRRAISADTALRLARHFGTSARFWMNLQTRYDLAVAERDHGARIAAEVDRAA
jgi:antitoxin HigA-1